MQVADGQPLYREALARWVRTMADMALVAVASNGRTALAQMRELRPDVAVLDHDLPGLAGVDVARAARHETLGARIVVLATASDGRAAFRALRNGAAAVLSRSVETGELADALRAVAAGRAVLPPEVQTSVAIEIRLRHERDCPALSAREREVLALAASDCTTSVIASRLHLSASTVKTHLHHVYDKLAARDRAAAVAAAFRLGLLE